MIFCGTWQIVGVRGLKLVFCAFVCLLGVKQKIMAGIIQKTELCVTDYGINLSLDPCTRMYIIVASFRAV